VEMATDVLRDIIQTVVAERTYMTHIHRP